MHDNLSPQEALYARQVEFMHADMAEFDYGDGNFARRSTLNRLGKGQRKALRKYLFAERTVDCDDIFEYRRKVLTDYPDLQASATEALEDLLNIMKWPPRYRRELLAEQESRSTGSGSSAGVRSSK